MGIVLELSVVEDPEFGKSTSYNLTEKNTISTECKALFSQK